MMVGCPSFIHEYATSSAIYESIGFDISSILCYGEINSNRLMTDICYYYTRDGERWGDICRLCSPVQKSLLERNESNSVRGSCWSRFRMSFLTSGVGVSLASMAAAAVSISRIRCLPAEQFREIWPGWWHLKHRFFLRCSSYSFGVNFFMFTPFPWFFLPPHCILLPVLFFDVQGVGSDFLVSYWWASSNFAAMA